ncbi:hypothetical protein [Elizabethkingia sp. JS20170427COW]|uniref:hypothetical protein n=1 Tax=Elizabethkingia sp. JS20170427COW TaxID=2583851 RepID=UPI00143D84A3|nr:hypothetical protein [Elizabethkingia sp. JS20170427COW]
MKWLFLYSKTSVGEWEISEFKLLIENRDLLLSIKIRKDKSFYERKSYGHSM